ncbi:MAG: M3 family oligoendopeptidase [Bacillota bacterium]
MARITKISDMQYIRQDIPALCESVKSFAVAIRNANSAEEILQIRKEYLEVMEELETATNIAYIRFSQNTKDEFYLAEQDYYDENTPALSAEIVGYQNAILNSPYAKQVEKAIGTGIFKLYECSQKCMCEEIIPEKQEEAKLVTEYTKYASALAFDFRSEKVPLTILRKYMSDSNRETRREAFEVLGEEFQKHSEFFDEIFDKLVKVRDKMAKKMGYSSFVEMGYYQMERVDYNREMVEAFRKNVLEYIVPAVCEVKGEVAKNLGIPQGDFKFYDNESYFEVAPDPILNAEDMMKAGKNMYCDMSSATAEFIDMMFEADAFDVLSRENKWGGGYCTYIPKYKQPFILANFNGTQADVDVLTHEAGHAFNSYETRNRDSEEGCGMETAEIHSMSMEFFCWKYMETFFGKRANDYKFSHLCDSLTFIPYGVIVDEFQHIVYDNPNLTPQERNAEYLKLEEKYRPYLSFEGMAYLQKGTRWQYQAHIFEMPFYYIDYCIAGSVALEFLASSQEDYQSAFSAYHQFILAGGGKSLEEKIVDAGLLSPFKDGGLAVAVQKAMEIIRKYK